VLVFHTVSLAPRPCLSCFRELLTVLSYVGTRVRDGYWRGQRLAALFACMYYAALRPAEAVALRRQDCWLPGTGWGLLTLEKSRPEVNRRWADTASAHEERGLKHRAATETRTVPIPPELVGILRSHIECCCACMPSASMAARRSPTSG